MGYTDRTVSYFNSQYIHKSSKANIFQHHFRHRRKLEGHEKGVRALAYNSDHRFMVSGGFDYDVLVWNPYVERLILRLHGHNAPIVGVEMVPDTPQIVTGDASGIIKVWDIRTFTCMQTFVHDDTGHHTDMKSFVCLPKEEQIITGAKKLRSSITRNCKIQTSAATCQSSVQLKSETNVFHHSHSRSGASVGFKRAPYTNI